MVLAKAVAAGARFGQTRAMQISPEPLNLCTSQSDRDLKITPHFTDKKIEGGNLSQRTEPRCQGAKGRSISAHLHNPRVLPLDPCQPPRHSHLSSHRFCQVSGSGPHVQHYWGSSPGEQLNLHSNLPEPGEEEFNAGVWEDGKLVPAEDHSTFLPDLQMAGSILVTQISAYSPCRPSLTT